MPTDLYFVLKYFSFTVTIHIAYSNTHLLWHNLFSPMTLRPELNHTTMKQLHLKSIMCNMENNLNLIVLYCFNLSNQLLMHIWHTVCYRTCFETPMEPSSYHQPYFYYNTWKIFSILVYEVHPSGLCTASVLK
jgi:hypothetical protein